MTPELLTVKAAAARAGIDRHRMGRVLDLGQCPSLLVGGKRMVSSEQLDAWMAGRVAPPVRLDAVRAVRQARPKPAPDRPRSREMQAILDAAR